MRTKWEHTFAMSTNVGCKMMGETKTMQVGVRMRPSLRKVLQQLADTDRRSLASYIELALEEHVEATRNAGRGR